MMTSSIPRRNQHIPTTLNHESLLPMAQNSPISMRYSVSCAGGKTVGTYSGVGGQVSESHPSVIDLNNENKAMDKKAVHWNMILLMFMAVCSALFTVVALQFHFSNSERFLRSAKSATSPYKGIIDVIRDVIASFDVAIVILSILTFFVSTLQLLFIMKIVKQSQHPADIDTALQYVKSTSFLRIVAFSFWFASIMVFVIVLMLTIAIDPSRSLASKCVSITLGSSAALLAICFASKTLYFWAKLSYGHVYRDDCYNYLSTLV
uniref:PGG domain-containing protein n=2 Tax=Caenorhabditis tropicalis TaxID=1561998 RepID=A0A1I7T9G4_9PELO